MLIFIGITVAGLVLLVGGSLFGHDHDAGHDGHFDHGHDAGGGGDPTVSLFSPRVIGTFIMGFGAGGAIATHYGLAPLPASFAGLGTGMLIALAMYGILRLIYSQQSTSLVTTSSAIGVAGTVTVAIAAGGTGEVELTLGGQHRAYLARSLAGEAVAKGRQVTIVRTVGSQVIVQEDRAGQPVA
jgi:membrane-bound ClpP family serine protease